MTFRTYNDVLCLYGVCFIAKGGNGVIDQNIIIVIHCYQPKRFISLDASLTNCLNSSYLVSEVKEGDHQNFYNSHNGM